MIIARHPLAKYYRLVEYRWDENRIYISIASDDQIYDKQECAKLISLLRNGGLVIDGSIVLDQSFYAGFFSQIDYVKKSEPKDYLKRLDEIIRVEVRHVGGSCEGKLISKEVLYRDK